MSDTDTNSSVPDDKPASSISRRSLLKGGGAVAAALGASALGFSSALASPAPRYRQGAKQTEITLMTFELFEAQEITAWRKVIGEFTDSTGIKVTGRVGLSPRLTPMSSLKLKPGL